MGFYINVLPLAISDIQEAYNWYEDEAVDLGERFLKYIDNAFLDLEQNPFYQIRYSNIRCYPIATFPFMIHFYINEPKNTIYITAILHTRKDSKNWI